MNQLIAPLFYSRLKEPKYGNVFYFHEIFTLFSSTESRYPAPVTATPVTDSPKTASVKKSRRRRWRRRWRRRRRRRMPKQDLIYGCGSWKKVAGDSAGVEFERKWGEGLKVWERERKSNHQFFVPPPEPTKKSLERKKIDIPAIGAQQPVPDWYRMKTCPPS